MRPCPFAVFGVLLFFAGPAAAQTSPSRDPQAALLLQKSLTELAGGTAVQSVTLSGDVRHIAGSIDESGNATLEGTADGGSRVDLTLPSGDRQQVRDVAGSKWTGSWSDQDGSWHPITSHNLWTDPTWFFPAFLIGRVLSNANYGISAAKTETIGGSSAQCIAVDRQYSGPEKLPSLVVKLSGARICLSPQTLLPVAVEFNVHPDNNALAKIPIRIEFSDYQSAQGDAVPYHIERYVQDGLVLDVKVTDAQLNTGLSASEFEVQ